MSNQPECDYYLPKDIHLYGTKAYESGDLIPCRLPEHLGHAAGYPREADSPHESVLPDGRVVRWFMECAEEAEGQPCPEEYCEDYVWSIVSPGLGN